jgi:hypothetical protein
MINYAEKSVGWTLVRNCDFLLMNEPPSWVAWGGWSEVRIQNTSTQWFIHALPFYKDHCFVVNLDQ